MESGVCICGGGTMGRGITLTIALSGIPVILYDLDSENLSAASSFIEKELQLAVSKKRITADEKINIWGRISFTRSVGDCRAPIIIEAIVEKIESKTALFRELDGMNSSKTIFATNTSSLSVTSIAEESMVPSRVVGLHFFNPANRMQLVEIIKTKFTSDLVVQRVAAFARQIGKTSVICKDTPGFIVNHVARPYYLEALRLAEQKLADPSSIDKLMESAGFKMGPFHLMDLIGNDINYRVSQELYNALGKPARLKPSSIQEAMVRKGALGKKTGGGYFEYDKFTKE
jgi:3-hydroxybutyryl-CoA dehydrogenase